MKEKSEVIFTHKNQSKNNCLFFLLCSQIETSKQPEFRRSSRLLTLEKYEKQRKLLEKFE